MKDTDITTSIQKTIICRGRYLTRYQISEVCREYRELLMGEIFEKMQTYIPGIGTIRAVEHQKKKVFGKVVKAHYCIKLKASKVLQRAINELHDVDKSK